MRTILTGSPITCHEAYEWGLVSEVAGPHTDVTKLAISAAIDILANGTQAVEAAKEAICRGMKHVLTPLSSY